MKISFFLMPQDWLEMSGLPVQNIQHLSHQNTSRNVLTSHQNNYPKFLIKTPASVSPKRPEMSRLPIKNLHLLSPQNTSGNVLTSHHGICFLSGNCPKLLIKRCASVAPKWLEMFELPIKNLQLLFPQKQLEMS